MKKTLEGIAILVFGAVLVSSFDRVSNAYFDVMGGHALGPGTSSGTPSGAAGGALGGNYPSPTLSAAKQLELDDKLSKANGGTVTAAGGVAVTYGVTAGTMTAAKFTGNVVGNVTGNASTASALQADPTNCGANTFANAIAASGNLTCAAVPNAATTADSANTASAIVARDANGAFAASKVTVSTFGVTALVNPLQQDCTTGQYQFGTGGLYLCVASGWMKAMAGATQITWTTY